jgi:hypothetical protein
MHTSDKYSTGIMQQLPEEFEYAALKDLVTMALSDQKISQDRKMALEEIIWLADSFYDIQFKHDSDISERVISRYHKRVEALKMLRFVRFLIMNHKE